MQGFKKQLRRNESYLQMKSYLEQQGYPFEPVHGPNHPYLLVHVGVGKPIKVFFPMSGSDHRNGNNSVRTVKRLIQKRLGDH